MLKLIRCFIVTVLLITTGSIYSQEIYTTEIGFHGGGSYFVGDVKAKFFDFQSDYGMIFRYVFNQRMTLQTDFNSTTIAGDYIQPIENLSNPEITINQNMYSLDFTFGFNFLDYGQLDYVLKSSNHTAYLFAGIGMIQLYNKNFNDLNFSIPFGFGYKFKLSKRLHLNLQWTHRLMLADNIEGRGELDNPLQLNGSNIFKNDHLGTATIGLSYSLFRKKCKCLNYK
ncbi:MAG: DUF6089 family protein [Paludibacter sp.]|nr:DUF6089 family protein [Paludibacter sp.]MDD4427364.1 DUF6089 family protein [Paludibacter sp.]